ncbi:hypothetical protein ZPAH1_orf00205 [Aeromonas phage ZPAH1]|nr:hypothetical protein ASwh1_156 [Aeromonas phage Aswh_1]QQG33967.1 hypothetical protein ZPAH1_orf00205 [Aeromonas phage ZPAH1]
MTEEEIQLFIHLRDDYGYYLTHFGFFDDPTTKAVYDAYFGEFKTVIIMEPNRGRIFDEIKYQIKKLNEVFDNKIIQDCVKSMKLQNMSRFIVVKHPMDLRGRGYSHLLVQDGFQHQTDFDEIVAPVVYTNRTKFNIIP